MRERSFACGDVRLFAVEEGEGAPLLMLHGGLSNRLGALRLLGGSLPGIRIIAPDLRGSGKSWASARLSWEDLADDVAAWMDELGLAACAVGGVSMGSGVALASALSHPSRVSELVLIHPVFPGQDQPLAAASREAMQAIGRICARAPVEGVHVLDELYRTLPPELRARSLAQLPELDAQSVGATAAFLASPVQPFKSAEELRRIRCRTLIVPGMDPSHPAEVAALYATRIPNAVVRHASLAEVPSVIHLFLQPNLGFGTTVRS